MAWQLEQRGKCQKCGSFAWQWDEDPHAYEADGLFCGGCNLLDIEKERRKDDPWTPGVHLVLYPKAVTADGS